MLTIKTAPRKFYDKWLYKVTLHMPGVALFRNYNLDEVEDFVNSIKVTTSLRNPRAKIVQNKVNLIKLSRFLGAAKSSIWHKRIEQDGIDLYTNSEHFFLNAIDEFSEEVIHAFKPTANLDLTKNNIIAAKKFPHNTYKYKVYLQPHKSKDKENKTRYVNWCASQGDKIRMSEAVKSWFVATDWNWDRRYILVDNESTLLMLKLRNSDFVGKIYEYVIVDK